MSTPRHALPSTPRTPPKRQRSEFSEELPSTWEATCEWVLTKRVSLWDMLLEPILLQVSLTPHPYPPKAYTILLILFGLIIYNVASQLNCLCAIHRSRGTTMANFLESAEKLCYH